jgi:broad specificity phosphatase PhoE
MVGHTVVNRVLLCAVLGLGNDSFWRIGQEPCAVNVFSIGDDGLKTLILLNDTSHLHALAEPSTGGIRDQQRD